MPSPPAERGGAPSPELLEFLGELPDDTGEWIDPEELDGERAAPGAGHD